METFPIVKRKDKKQYDAFREIRIVLEIYDVMQRAIETGKLCQTCLVSLAEQQYRV